MADLDLDKVHAAERESNGQPPKVTIGGVTYTLPVKMPVATAIAASENDLRLMVSSLFGAENTETVASLLDIEDIPRLAELYGIDEGNSEASAGS